MSDKNPVLTMRLGELGEWAKTHAVAHRISGGRTGLVRELLQAYRDRRLILAPGPAPYHVNDGSDRDFPVLVCLKPQ